MTIRLQQSYFFLHFVLLGLLAVFTTPYMATAAIAYSFFIWGLYFRKFQTWHVYLMSAGMVLDLSLVLILEFQRGAIATAIGDSLNIFQLSHIISSTLAVILYIPVAILGFGRWKKKWDSHSTREWHIRLGILAFAFRTVGFILMFSLLELVRS